MYTFNHSINETGTFVNVDLKCERRIKMDSILHPVSGESGYFCSIQEKVLIDAVFTDYAINQLVTESSANGRGVEHD
jgi:hypothetical protein